jgi:single-stranded DNA-binding protein
MSMTGFIVSDPTVIRTDDGTTKVRWRVGQEHWTRNPDATFTQQANSYHDLVMFRAAGQKGAAVIEKGDRFVADGYTHTHQAPNRDGVMVEREDFVARHIGHDTLHTVYTVDRTPRVQKGPSNTPALEPVPTTCDDIAAGLV